MFLESGAVEEKVTKRVITISDDEEEPENNMVQQLQSSTSAHWYSPLPVNSQKSLGNGDKDLPVTESTLNSVTMLDNPGKYFSALPSKDDSD